MNLCRLFCFVGLGLWTAAPASGVSVEATVERMEARLPAIMKLKVRGDVGVTNDALLSERSVLSPKEGEWLEQENADRRALFSLLARRNGFEGNKLRTQRARRIRAKAPEGVWLQDEEGDWYGKGNK